MPPPLLWFRGTVLCYIGRRVEACEPIVCSLDRRACRCAQVPPPRMRPPVQSQELLQYLREQVKCKDREIFIVVTQEVGRVKGCYLEARSTPPRQASQQSVAATMREHPSRTGLR